MNLWLALALPLVVSGGLVLAWLFHQAGQDAEELQNE